MEILSSDFSQLSLSLLDAETADAKDVKYIVNEFSETLVENFGTKSAKPVKSKLPTPVSKAAAKSGSVSYDPNTLANRFTAIYPELRDEYKANCEKYGQFLSEDFFINHGNAAVIETIKEIPIDKILLEWQRKEEYRTHGKTISDKWGKNLEETLEIAKINWIED